MTKLQEMRKKRSLSQKELCSISGVSFSILKKYESGERNLNKTSGEILLRLATALSCQMEDLLSVDDKEILQTEVMQQMYNEWRIEGIKAGEDSGLSFSWNSGDSQAREDFAYFWSINRDIPFKEMLNYETNFDAPVL